MKTDETTENVEMTYKILMIGDYDTGKTCIIKRCVPDSLQYIGEDFAIKSIYLNNGTRINLQLFDTCGQERFKCLTKNYYVKAVVAFIVFDVTRMSTFDSITNWKTDIHNICPSIPIILIANKIDLIQSGCNWGRTQDEMDKFCEEFGFSGWIETSALANIGIDNVIQKLTYVISEKIYKPAQNKYNLYDSDVTNLNEQKTKLPCCY